jgi:hypothetical protein
MIYEPYSTAVQYITLPYITEHLYIHSTLQHSTEKVKYRNSKILNSKIRNSKVRSSIVNKSKTLVNIIDIINFLTLEIQNARVLDAVPYPKSTLRRLSHRSRGQQ